MPCQFIRTPNGTTIICGPRSRAKPTACWECHRPGTFQCDGPVGTATCDRYLCVHHRCRAEAGVDYCRECDPSLRLL